MVVHYFTLEALCKELRPLLSGATVLDLLTQTRNQLIVRIEKEGVESALAVSVDPGFNYFYYRTSAFQRARRNSTDVLEQFAGKKILDLNILPDDRMIIITGSDGLSLHLRIYNTVRSNVFLVDGAGGVVTSFKQGEEHGIDASVAARASTGESALGSGEAFARLFGAQGTGNAFQQLKATLPLFGSLFVREALFRAGIEEAAPPETLDAARIEMLFAAIRSIEEERAAPQPVIYRRDGVPSVFSVIPLRHLGSERGEKFSTVNQGVRQFVHEAFRVQAVGTEKDGLLGKLRQMAAAAHRSLESTLEQQKHAGHAPGLERSGTLLMSNLDRIRKGMKEITLPDIVAGTGDLRIALDPKLTPVQNAERYFDKAKKAKLATRELDGRKATLTGRAALLDTMLHELETRDSVDEVKEFKKRYHEELRAMHIIDEESGEEEFPFRRFTVIGGFEVWVGKNSANNDLLTMRYARPNDLWFHARGASGSHTVLRIDDQNRRPSKEAIESAAGIAAYYSKMRNASSVPVAFCERKYVSKGKRMAEGAVYMAREKVILAKPRLPEK